MKRLQTSNPLSTLPRHLKERENYKPIQKKLFGILQSTHSHAEVMDYAKCFPCQQRFQKYKEEKAKLGFVSTAQFLKWEKVGKEIMDKYGDGTTRVFI